MDSRYCPAFFKVQGPSLAMEHKRAIDSAGLSGLDDGHDPKRICLPPLDEIGRYSSQYWDQTVGDAYQSMGYAWMQPNDEFIPSNVDDFSLEEDMNLDQLPERDVNFNQIFESGIEPQQLTDYSVTSDCTPQLPLVAPSPPSVAEEHTVYKEDRGSEVKEVDTCFGAVRFLPSLSRDFEAALI